MTREYDFSKGKRGLVVPIAPGKTRITIRIDDDILKWFRAKVHAAGGGNYQSLINLALREYIQKSHEPLEQTLRRILREEFAAKTSSVSSKRVRVTSSGRRVYRKISSH